MRKNAPSDLAQQAARGRIETLGRPAQRRGVGRHPGDLAAHRGEGVAGHHHQDFLRPGDGIFELAADQQMLREGNAGKVTAVLPVAVEGLDLFRGMCPQYHRLIRRQFDGQRGTPGAGTQYRDGIAHAALDQ